MKKKLATLVAMLALLLLAFAPLVLAQQEDPSSAPPSDPSSVPADPGVAPSLVTPSPGSAVGCQELYGYSTAFCMVNGDGLITLPDGSTAPVLVQPDGRAFIVDESGNLIPAGTSAPEDPGFAQYDSAQG